jgi:hypothetical protein
MMGEKARKFNDQPKLGEGNLWNLGNGSESFLKVQDARAK